MHAEVILIIALRESVEAVFEQQFFLDLGRCPDLNFREVRKGGHRIRRLPVTICEFYEHTPLGLIWVLAIL